MSRLLLIISAALFAGIGIAIWQTDCEAPGVVVPASLVQASPSRSGSSSLVFMEPVSAEPQLISVGGVDATASPHECHEEALRVRIMELEAEVSALTTRIKELESTSMLLAYPADTPYGAFLRSWDADLLSTPEERDWAMAFLDDFTIMLNPGDIYWLHTQCQDGIWQGWSYDYFLARARMLEARGYNLSIELPPDDAAYLATYYDEG